METAVQPNLKEIILDSADYVRASKFTVSFNKMIPSVSIQGEAGSFYLQGHEADEYLDKVQDLYQTVGNVRYMDVLYSFAKQYVDSL